MYLLVGGGVETLVSGPCAYSQGAMVQGILGIMNRRLSMLVQALI